MVLHHLDFWKCEWCKVRYVNKIEQNVCLFGFCVSFIFCFIKFPRPLLQCSVRTSFTLSFFSPKCLKISSSQSKATKLICIKFFFLSLLYTAFELNQNGLWSRHSTWTWKLFTAAATTTNLVCIDLAILAHSCAF